MYKTVQHDRIIRERRKKARSTIEEAAERYDLSITELLKIEFGGFYPKLFTMLRIAIVPKMDLGGLSYCRNLPKVLI